jgi:hypothetical protein
LSAKPQLLAWLTCDSIYIDPVTGKQSLLGIFSKIKARQFPFAHPKMIWFISITDCKAGDHILNISMGLPMEEQRQILSREFKSESPVQRINLINEIHNLKFSEAGNYSVHIEVDNETILAMTFPVLE